MRADINLNAVDLSMRWRDSKIVGNTSRNINPHSNLYVNQVENREATYRTGLFLSMYTNMIIRSAGKYVEVLNWPTIFYYG